MGFQHLLDVFIGVLFWLSLYKEHYESPERKEISWAEFVSEYLTAGTVDRIEVGIDGWGKVVFTGSGPCLSLWDDITYNMMVWITADLVARRGKIETEKDIYLRVGSQRFFEKNVRQALKELEVKSSDLINVVPVWIPGLLLRRVFFILLGATWLVLRYNILEMCLSPPVGKTKTLRPEERRRVACHEAGHAVACWFLQFTNTLEKVSIVPGEGFLGYVMFQPEERYLLTDEALQDEMCVALGGRCSELLFYGNSTTGACSDLQMVTQSAYAQIMSYGMSEKVGPVSFKNRDRPLGDYTANLIDEEVRKLIDTAMERTMRLLTEKKHLVESLTSLLLEREVLEREDIAALLGEPDRPLTEDTRSEVENITSQSEN